MTTARNRWPLAAAWGLLVIALATAGACANPCEKLARKVCEEVGDGSEECGEWKAKIDTLNRETCEASLVALEAATR
jgi:hypothetical protein